MEKFEIQFQKLKKYNGNDTTVTIDEGITAIDAFAFSGNGNLEEVILPSSVTTIGDYAFYGCQNLKFIHHLENVEDIGDGAFSGCYKLDHVVLPEGLTYLSKSLFYKCLHLRSIHLPSTLRIIEDRAFSFCTSLENLTIPNNVYQLGKGVFEECTSLKNIALPKKLLHIKDKAFFHTPSLQKIEIPEEVQTIGEAALQTHGQVTIISNDDIFITPKMLDYNYNLNWNYSFKFKNGENYVFIHSYLPNIELEDFKPQVKANILTNFLETYDLHKDPSKYVAWCKQYYVELLKFIIHEKRYVALNNGLDHQIIHPDDLTQYLSSIQDKEEKVKLMEYQSNHNDTSIDSLEKDLLDLF